MMMIEHVSATRHSRVAPRSAAAAATAALVTYIAPAALATMLCLVRIIRCCGGCNWLSGQRIGTAAGRGRVH